MRESRNLVSVLTQILAADPEARSDVRRAAGRRGSTCPVVVVEGAGAPHEEGESYFFTTPSGRTRVEHPRAYGWPTLYHPSTLRIEVGAQWLDDHGFLACALRQGLVEEAA